MSRRHAAEKRKVLPDPKFKDVVLTKFINYVMYDGKKSVAESNVYGALDLLQAKRKQDPIGLFHDILKAVAPQLEVKSRRVGGATFQVPIEVRADRGQSLAMRMLIDAARKRSEHTIKERLAGEMNDVLDGRGTSLKKREDMHKMAEANKAFAHFRF